MTLGSATAVAPRQRCPIRSCQVRGCEGDFDRRRSLGHLIVSVVMAHLIEPRMVGYSVPKQIRDVSIGTAALFDRTDESLSEAWSKTDRALRELADYLESQDLAYIPFKIPMDAQVDESEQKPWFVEASKDTHGSLESGSRAHSKGRPRTGSRS